VWVFIAQGNGQSINNFLKNRLAGDRIITLKVFTAYSGRGPRDRVRDKGKTMIGHTFLIGISLHEIFKFKGADWGSGDSQFFNCPAMAGDRRRAGTSMTYTHNHAMAFFFYFRPKLGIVVKICADFCS
jgi:hypothetical protein